MTDNTAGTGYKVSADPFPDDHFPLATPLPAPDHGAEIIAAAWERAFPMAQGNVPWANIARAHPWVEKFARALATHPAPAARVTEAMVEAGEQAHAAVIFGALSGNEDSPMLVQDIRRKAFRVGLIAALSARTGGTE